MPIYVVRWPDLSVSIVKAANLKELIGLLDQVADPTNCRISLLRGPLFLTFRLDVEYDDEADPPKIGDVSNLLDRPNYVVEAPEGDAHFETVAGMTRLAFPHYWKALDRSLDLEDKLPGKPVERRKKPISSAIIRELAAPPETRKNRQVRNRLLLAEHYGYLEPPRTP